MILPTNMLLRHIGRLVLAMTSSLVLLETSISAALPLTTKIQIHNHTRQSLIDVQRGNKSASLNSLINAQSLMNLHSRDFSLTEHTKIQSLIKSVKETKDLSSLTFRNEFRTKVNSIDPLEDYTKPNTTFSSPRGPVSNLLRRMNNAVPHVFFTTTNVKMFGTEFRKGISEPDRTFRTAKFVGEERSSNAAKVVSQWERTEQAKRVFVTGSSQDVSTVLSLKRQYGDEGYMLFFYQDCKPLCGEATVGAFFATSAAVIHIQSPGTEKSPYIPIEVGLIQETYNIGRKIYIIDSDELKRNAETGGSFVTATLMTCTVGSLLLDSEQCLNKHHISSLLPNKQ